MPIAEISREGFIVCFLLCLPWVLLDSLTSTMLFLLTYCVYFFKTAINTLQLSGDNNFHNPFEDPGVLFIFNKADSLMFEIQYVFLQ